MNLKFLSITSSITLCSLTLISSLNTSAAQAKSIKNTQSHSRLIKNADGSMTQYLRDAKNTKLEQITYTERANGQHIIRTRTTYVRDRQGRLRSGIIEDGQRVKLYKLRYGYERKTGRLIAEDMFDARKIRRNDPKNPNKETPIRALRYSYTAQGVRSKPLIYSGLKGKTARELTVWLKKNKLEKTTLPEHDYFAPKTANPNAKRLRK